MVHDDEIIDVVSCGALVYRFNTFGDLQFLLIKPYAHVNRWGIPKGHMDDGESYVDCALREVFEEVGLHVELEDRLPDVYTMYDNERKTVVSFLARPVDTSAVPVPQQGEVSALRWFFSHDLPIVHAYQRPLLQAGIDIIGRRV